MAADRRGRALAIHPGALGDVLQAVPALRALGGPARVAFSGQPRLAALLVGAGVAGEALSFDGLGLEMLFTEEPASPALTERLARFTEVVSWFGARDPRYPRRLAALVPAAVVAPPVPGPEDGTTVWQHLVATLGPGRAPAGREPIGVPEAWRAAARRAVAGIGVPAGARWLLVHPGAGGAWKLGPPATLARIVREAAAGTDVWPIVHEGPADRQAADATAALIEPSPGRLVEPPLPVLAAVLSMSAGYLGGDSGVSHLAAAVGARAVLLYPAATRGRWAPWSPTARVLGLADADLTERAASALRESIGGEGSGETGA